MPTPEPMSILDSINTLTAIGVFPVIAVVATLGLATVIYKRFRR